MGQIESTQLHSRLEREEGQQAAALHHRSCHTSRLHRSNHRGPGQYVELALAVGDKIPVQGAKALTLGQR